MKAPETVEQYIAQFPERTQLKLKELRAIIHKYALNVKEGISYGMPSYKGKRILFYFGGFKEHISFFPTASGIYAFQKDLENFKTSKGTVQFPLDSELPEELIGRMILHRLEEDKNK